MPGPKRTQRRSPLRVLVLTLTGACTLATTGCGKQEDIIRYTVPKPHKVYEINHVEPDEEPTHQMLGAIVPRNHKALFWFFKLVGPKGAIDANVEEFSTFIESVSFSSETDMEPKWNLPKGWRAQPGQGMRYATLQLDSDEQPLEVTVTLLVVPPKQYPDTFELANINRWRDQMGLSPMTRAQLRAKTKRWDGITEVKLASGETATLFDLLGRVQPKDKSDAPFALGMGPFASSMRPSFPPPSRSAKPPITYQTPDGWTSGRGTGLSVVAFHVDADDQKVKITVTPLAAAAGQLVPNVDRWCRQIGLSPLTQSEQKQKVQEMQVDGRTGHFVELNGAADAQGRQTILGVIVIDEDKAWFLKLMGDFELAQREKKRFHAFVQSVKFRSADGAGNGE